MNSALLARFALPALLSAAQAGADQWTDIFAESGSTSAMLAHNWLAIGLRGALGIIFGTIAIMMPGVTMSVLIVWFATYMFLDGTFAIEAGLSVVADDVDWAGLICEGVVKLIAGAVAFMWPIATLLVLVWIMGGSAVVSGVLLLIAAFRLQSTHGKWFLALSGIASTFWGVLLSIAPVSGIGVMIWWFGAYALIFGLALLALAFRLRRLHMYQAGSGDFSMFAHSPEEKNA